MKSDESTIFNSNKKWFMAFFPLAWLGHIGIGLALGVFGPTQPYLAKNVSTNVDTINFIWTGRSIGFALAAIIAAFVFKRYFTTTRGKLTYLALAEVFTGIFIIITPFIYNFPLLIVMVTIYGLGLGLFDTADNSLIVYMLGPKESRPFTQSLHAFVGVGFILSSVLVQPFLPQNQEESKTVCPGMDDQNSTGGLDYDPRMMGNIPSINWPYIIIGIWHFVAAAGLLFLGFSGLQMPSYYSKNIVDNANVEKVFTNVQYWKSLLVMIYFYYVFTCGLEGFFMSMTYTYGICGPLEMTVSEAALLNTLYYGAFLVGRFSGIIISKYLKPTYMILSSLLGCVTSAILLSVLSATSKIGLYLGTSMMGFFVSFLFASGLSWTAGLFDVTGNASFIFFLGGFSGFLSIPPIAGTIFTADDTKVGFFYLALGITILHTILFISMLLISKIKKNVENRAL